MSARKWALSYVTRKLSIQEKPILALAMERTEGEARFEATTTKQIFQAVREHAASIGAARSGTVSAVTSAMGDGPTLPPPPNVMDWDESAPSIAVAALRLRAESGSSQWRGSNIGYGDCGGGNLVTRLVRYRDIDRLSPIHMSFDSPAFLVRRHAVLLLLDPLRAVIMADRFILVVPDGADNIMSIMNAYIAGWPCRKKDIDFSSDKESDGYVPFEYLVFEAVLETVIAVQNQEFLACADKTRAILHSIKDASLISLQKQEKMAFFKTQIASMLSRCRQHRKALEELMNDDDALALMNLSRLKRNPALYSMPLDPSILKYHEDAEALFDSYQIEFSSLETKIQLLKEEFHNAEDLASLRLATSQNKLLFAESLIILSTVFLTTGGFIGGLFGMNLPNHVENHENAFRYIVTATCLFVTIGTFVVYKYFRATGTFPKLFDLAYFNFGEWSKNY